MPGDAGRRSWPASGARPRWRWAAVALVLGTLGAPLGGCATGEGRDLRTPSPDQTTSTMRPGGSSVGSAPGGGAGGADPEAVPLEVTSTAFTEAGVIPDDHTCRGRGVSPSLLWSTAPSGTVEIAVVVRDLHADGFVHWVVAGLPPESGGLAVGTLPAGAVEATNGFGRPGWAGPCPTDGTHRYEFRVYALSAPSGVTAGMPGADAASRVEMTPALASGVLSGEVAPA